MIGVLKGTTPLAGAHLHGALRSFRRARAAAGDTPDTDRIFNGAVDNASGVAGMLEIAQAFARAARAGAIRST